MAYEWQKNDSFPKAKRARLGFVEIGGIGEINYKIVRYSKYEFQDGVDLDDYGISGNVIAPVYGIKPTLTYDNSFTGKKILMSLINLAYDINRYGTPSYVEQIMKWCEENVHPYDIETLYEKYVPMAHEEDRAENPEPIDGVFNVDRFMKDLKYLYQIFVFYYDFVELVKGNPDRAFNHYQEGRHFDTLPFFEEYKSSDWKLHKNPTREYMENAPSGHELLKEMMDDAKNYVDPTESTKEQFRKFVLKDKKRIYELVASWIPDMKMFLKYDIKANEVLFTANVDSVFDIAWYSFARLVASNAPSQDTDMNSDSVNWSEGYYGVCENCHRFFLKKSNRARYCEMYDCQAARNRKKQQKYQLRKKELEK